MDYVSLNNTDTDCIQSCTCGLIEGGGYVTKSYITISSQQRNINQLLGTAHGHGTKKFLLVKYYTYTSAQYNSIAQLRHVFITRYRSSTLIHKSIPKNKITRNMCNTVSCNEPRNEQKCWEGKLNQKTSLQKQMHF